MCVSSLQKAQSGTGSFGTQAVELSTCTRLSLTHMVMAYWGDPANGEMYPAGAFEGVGRIGLTNVSCIAAPFVLGFRNGFEPRDVDYHDVNALCAEFGLALPCSFQAKQDKHSN